MNATVFLLKPEDERRKQDCANLGPADWDNLQVAALKTIKINSDVLTKPNQCLQSWIVK